MNYTDIKLSEQQLGRVETIKQESIDVVQEVCAERARILTRTYMETESQPMIIRRAKALYNILNEMTVFIEDSQLIAGNQAGKLRAAPMFPEYSAAWITDEIDELSKRPGDRFEVSAEARKSLLETAGWWRGKTLHERCMSVLPPEAKAAYKASVLSANGNMTSGDGHIMLDFEMLLEQGAGGIIERAKRKMEALDETVPGNYPKRVFYESVCIAYEGVINFARRYSALAGEKAEAEQDAKRKAELIELSEICARVPEHPARTFKEGLQSVWFAHLISQIESNGHSMSFGRLDQYLYPYYEADKESGLLTDEDVVERLACLWIKAFGVIKIRPWNHTRFSGGGPTYQNLTLGGISPDGKDAVNELSMLCLDSIQLTRLPQPNVSARYNMALTPRAFLKKCIETMRLGFGMPAMHNDDLMIPSLLARGIALEDANNYAIVGCIEPIIPGKFGYRAAGMSFTNFPKILEITLNGGKDPRTGTEFMKDMPVLSDFKSFDELKHSFERHMEYFVKVRVMGEAAIDYSIEELVPDAFCSALVQDCIERGQNAKEGGSHYDMVTGPETGVTNAGNSLAAIRQLVFDEGKLTQVQLQAALASDFAGIEGERIRQLLLNKAPKFGNDDDMVDELVAYVYKTFIREQAKYPTVRLGRGPIGCLSYPCTATISGNVPSGAVVLASADGRKSGEALTEGCSPFHGSDTLGPTAVINSISKVPNMSITGGNLLNLKIAPSSLDSEEGINRMEALIRTFCQLKCCHVQFNVVSGETLKKAKATPEKYRDLVVRVAGYSALFTILEPATQDDIIARTEHCL